LYDVVLIGTLKCDKMVHRSHKQNGAHKMTITLSNDKKVQVPDGADPRYFRKVKEAGIRLSNGKKVKTPRHNGRPKKKVNYGRLVL